jgi:hypothetical protein
VTYHLVQSVSNQSQCTRISTLLYQTNIFHAKGLFESHRPKALTLVIEEDDSGLNEGSQSFSAVEHSFPDDDGFEEVEFGPPETEAELRCWEEYKDRAISGFAVHKEHHPEWEMPNLRVVMGRRGPKAQGLDPVYCNVQGPVRHDPRWFEMVRYQMA